jgi:hypothetical protein
MNTYNYYQEQLDRLELNEENTLIVKFTTLGVYTETKHMLIDKDSIDVFIKFLQDLKEKL